MTRSGKICRSTVHDIGERLKFGEGCFRRFDVDLPVTRPAKPARWKRTFDLLTVIASLPVVLPVAALIALLVRINLGAPVLFTQVRPGLAGRPFRMIKFRSMLEPRPGEPRLPGSQLARPSPLFCSERMVGRQYVPCGKIETARRKTEVPRGFGVIEDHVVLHAVGHA